MNIGFNKKVATCVYVECLDKYFGNVPAVLAYLAKEKLFTTNQYNEKNELQSKLRDLSIRLDRLEAVNNL